MTQNGAKPSLPDKPTTAAGDGSPTRAFFECDPIIPCVLSPLDSQHQRICFTSDRVGATIERNRDALTAESYECALLLPSGSRSMFRVRGSELPSLPERVGRALSSATRASDRLALWGLQARAKHTPPLSVWIDTVPPILRQDVLIEPRTAVAPAVPFVRVTLTANVGVVRLISEPNAEVIRARHVLPLQTSQASMVFDVVAVKESSDRQAEFQVFYPPSLETSFWHFASSGLREGAAILGSELLARTVDLGRNASPQAIHLAGIHVLRFGSEDDARLFVETCARRSPPQPDRPIERAIALLQILLKHELTGSRAAADDDVLAQALAGDPADALPLTSIEMARAAEISDQIAAEDPKTKLADRADAYRSWAGRLDPRASIPAYDTPTLQGPAHPPPERPQDRQLALARAKKKSAGLRLQLAS